MFTVLIYGQTRIETFTVLSFGHIYSVILNSVILTSLVQIFKICSKFFCSKIKIEKVLIDSVKFIDCSGRSFGGSFWNQGPDHSIAVSHPDALPV